MAKSRNGQVVVTTLSNTPELDDDGMPIMNDDGTPKMEYTTVEPVEKLPSIVVSTTDFLNSHLAQNELRFTEGGQHRAGHLLKLVYFAHYGLDATEENIGKSRIIPDEKQASDLVEVRAFMKLLDDSTREKVKKMSIEELKKRLLS